jgi:hypothetical protein
VDGIDKVQPYLVRASSTRYVAEPLSMSQCVPLRVLVAQLFYDLVDSAAASAPDGASADAGGGGGVTPVAAGVDAGVDTETDVATANSVAATAAAVTRSVATTPTAPTQSRKRLRSADLDTQVCPIVFASAACMRVCVDDVCVCACVVCTAVCMTSAVICGVQCWLLRCAGCERPRFCSWCGFSHGGVCDSDWPRSRDGTMLRTCRACHA